MKPLILFPIFSLLIVALAAGCSGRDDQSITKEFYGTTYEGESVDIYTLTNSNGLQARITNYGAIVQSLLVPDRDNNLGDIVLGYDTLEEYIDYNPFFGAIVGRFGNRIEQGRFSLNGTTYQLTINDGNNHLHGGTNGFFARVWDAEPVHSDLGPALKLTYHSPHMEEGYPGNLTIEVVYTLTDNNELKIDYTATTDQKTIVNPTHHSYFNLAADPSQSIEDQVLMIEADRFTPINDVFIPTGVLQSVGGTPMDFRQPIRIGARIDEADEQLQFAGGYDHNWVLNNHDGSVRTVASLYHEESGRFMELLTDQPGLQFYSGNFLDGSITGKGGEVYPFRSGLCLEAQHFPNSPNEEDFPSVTLNPGETYRQTTIHRFSVR